MNGDTPVNIAGVFAFPNDEGGRQIRFIDSDYNTLFHVPDGGSIILTAFDDGRRTLPCRYIDDAHAVIGGSTYHICEFAEIAERNGSVYAPEHPKEGDICDTYTIYQIKDIRAVPYSFEPFAAAKAKLRMADYARAYRGVLAPKVTLDELFAKHNRDSRPFAQRMRSMSMSDVVVLSRGGAEKAYYIEWLRQSRGQPTFRSMLEADLRTAMEDANDLGHFFLLMEHKGWEISHGNRLGFRLRGQDRFMYPGRKNPLFTEDGIRAAIQSSMADIELGHRPAVIYRPPYRPFKKYPKYTGFMALYVHYLYVLGKVEKRQYPPRMTPQLRQEVIRFERYREQFAFLRDNGIATSADMEAFQTRTEETLTALTKQRTILNVRKKKRRTLYAALADTDALASAKVLYEDGLSGMEAEYTRYMEAVAVLGKCSIPRDRLMKEKAEIYEQLAEINRQIRAERKKLKMCQEIQSRLPQIERTIEKIEVKEVSHDERRRR